MTAVFSVAHRFHVRPETVILMASFAHENQPTPPSLTQNGEMRFGTKSALLPILEEMMTQHRNAPAVDASLKLIIDCMMAVQILQPKKSTHS